MACSRTQAAVFLTWIAIIATDTRAEVVSKPVAYQDGDAQLEGSLYWDNAIQGERPGVLVVHEWWGLNDYARSRAEKLAKLGYVAFALDMYGKGKVTQHPSQAGEWATMIRKNTDAWRQRAKAGLRVLQASELSKDDQLAAIGYCFGGSTVLQLAYANEPLRAVVSFHGALPEPPADGKIGAKVLVCHGADDGFVPESSITKFRAGLTRLGADWQMVYYANARHGFTNVDAGDYGLDGLRYDKNADRRSWALMRSLFDECLR